MKKICLYSVSIILFLSIYTGQTSAAYLKLIDINPLNRVTLEFDTIPSQLISSLSDSKMLVSLNIGKSKFNDKFNNVSGLGIITDVYIKYDSGNTVINIKTKEKRGYTVIKYPFTNKLVVEVFQWEKLSPEEELYRTGLLAAEDEIISESVRNLYNASRKGIDLSAFNLGLSYLKSGYFNEAETSFKYSYHVDSNNIDALAGIAVSLNLQGKSAEAAEYSNKFADKCNCNFIFLPDTSRTVLDSAYLDLSHFQIPVDTLPTPVIASNDSTHVPAQTSKSDEIKIDSGNIFNSVEKFLIYAIIIVAITAIALLFYYLKWRKSQILLMQKQKATLFNESLNEAKSKIPPSAAVNRYKAQDKEQTTHQADKRSTEEQYNNFVSAEKMDKLGSIIESITGKSVDNYKQNPEIPNLNAKLQLANHLAEEQRKIKNQKLQNLKVSSLPKDKDKLSDVARKLGIEKGGLETKDAMEKIINDKDKLKNMSDKFGN
ncbi:MAG: hypothetical protein RBT61_12095 [Candidatus Kapabacteria bacterium]|jgi:hypothetical protein|nr:hypothetical protein [Candidatus Kapabacteria bacterium]